MIEPLLIDEDYYARVEGREIISNLAKAAGLATMISTMRPDIDNIDEYVRNTTARAFAVVASALGKQILTKKNFILDFLFYNFLFCIYRYSILATILESCMQIKEIMASTTHWY